MVTELRRLRKKQHVIRKKETYKTEATLPSSYFFFPHSFLLVLLLSIPMKNKLSRVMIPMTCSQPHFSQLPILTVMYKLPPCSHAKKQDSTRGRLLTFGLCVRTKLEKCYIWSIALYGTETRTLWKVDQNTQKILKRGTEDEYSRSVGLIVRTMKKYYVH